MYFQISMTEGPTAPFISNIKYHLIFFLKNYFMKIYVGIHHDDLVSENISVVSQPVRFPEEDVKQPQIEYEYDYYDYEEIGSVRLVEQKFPEVFWNGIWTPIC